MANRRVGGIAYLKVDGDQYPLRGNFTVSPLTSERNGVAGQDYVHGYTETPRVPFIEGDVTLVPELSVEDLGDVVDATVTAELANGSTYVLTEAWTRRAFELNAAEGMVRVRFEGVECYELRG
jgi:hypothetical protein